MKTVCFSRDESLLLLSVFRNVPEWQDNPYSVYFDLHDWFSSTLSSVLFQDLQKGCPMLTIAGLSRDNDINGVMSIPLYRKVKDLDAVQCEDLYTQLKRLFHIEKPDKDFSGIQIGSNPQNAEH